MAQDEEKNSKPHSAFFATIVDLSWFQKMKLDRITTILFRSGSAESIKWANACQKYADASANCLIKHKGFTGDATIASLDRNIYDCFELETMTGSCDLGEFRFFRINNCHRKYFFSRYDSNKVCFLHYKASGCGGNALRFLSWDSSISIKHIWTQRQTEILNMRGEICSLTQSLTWECQNS